MEISFLVPCVDISGIKRTLDCKFHWDLNLSKYITSFVESKTLFFLFEFLFDVSKLQELIYPSLSYPFKFMRNYLLPVSFYNFAS